MNVDCKCAWLADIEADPASITLSGGWIRRGGIKTDEEEEKACQWSPEEGSFNTVHDLILTMSSATNVNRWDILHINALNTPGINPQEVGPMLPTTTTNKKSPSRWHKWLQDTPQKIELMNTCKRWQMKMTWSRMSLSKSYDSERILEMPEPNGLGEGFTL